MKLAEITELRERVEASDIDILTSVASGLAVPDRLLLPTSWVGHVPFGSWLMKALRPRVVVELGVHTGNSFFTFAEASVRHATPTQLYGIDTWGGDDHAGHYSEDVFADVSAYTASRFADRVHLIRKRFEDAVGDFADRSIDLLHIDGLHTYEAVKSDFETWRSKLSERAVVLFHDVAVVTEGFGVARFWGEISDSFPHMTFTHSNGLGVLLVGSQVPAEVSMLVENRRATGAALLFEKLGDALCRVMEHGPDATALPVNPTLDPPRVYLADTEAFDESHAADLVPCEGYAGLLRRDLPIYPATGGLFMRIDPMNRKGLRGIHRVLLVPRERGVPIELVVSPTDRRAHLTIVPTKGGNLFVGTGEDSQWYPVLDRGARDCIAQGAALLMEPMAVPNAELSRLLLQALDQLVEPLQARIDRLAQLEQRDTFALAREIEEVFGQAAAGLPGPSTDTAGMTPIVLRDLVTRQRETHLDVVRLTTELDALRSRHDVVVAERDDREIRLSAALERKHRSNDYMTQLHSLLFMPSPDDRVEQRLLAVAGRMEHDADPDTATAGKVFLQLLHRRESMRGALLVLRKKYATAGRPATDGRSDAPFLMEPVSGLLPVGDEGTKWRAFDDDPQFALPELCGFRGRWVRVTIDLEFSARHPGSPVIYLDCGRGMSEQSTIKMPRPLFGIGKTSLVLPVPVDLVMARFDPCSGPSEFALSSVTITPLSRLRAIAIMGRALNATGQLRRLWEDYRPEWRKLRNPAARRDLKTDFVQSYRQTTYSASSTYTEWIRLFEVPAKSYDALKAARTAWPRLPLISLLMPTYETPARLLREAIESVTQQDYPHWELCIADDASMAPHVRRILEDAASADPRIKLTFRATNGHIVAASNDALALASGEFAGLLDHDDRLHPLALHYMAEAILEHPDATVFFSDEDKITMDGIRHHPHFKCAFNDPLILAQNSVNHFGCYSVASMRELGGFRAGLEGAQDWDLVLRMYQRFGAKKIVHVPRVLYHWRETLGSTALATTEKPYAESAGRRAVIDHLARCGIAADVVASPDVPSWNRIRYATNKPLPKVTIVIPTRDKVDVLATCVDSIIARTTYPDYEVIIIDNGSVEAATDVYLRGLPQDKVRIIRDESPFNYSRLNNDAVKEARGDYICLLNNDTEVLTADWLEEMMGLALQPEVGIVGARLWYPDGRVQHAGVVLGIGGVAGHVHRLATRGEPGYFGRGILQQQFSAVTAACLLISRELWDTLGGLDEELEVAFNDIDLCVRATVAGKQVVWTPFAELVHYESLSRGADDTPLKAQRFETEKAIMRRRWADVLDNDPFYSPNLSLIPADDFTLSWEPRLP